MLTRPEMITDGLADRFADGRIFLGTEARLAEHLIDGIGVHGTEEFAEGIGPTIFRSAGNVERTWRSEREQVMRIKRQLVFLL